MISTLNRYKNLEVACNKCIKILASEEHSDELIGINKLSNIFNNFAIRLFRTVFNIKHNTWPSTNNLLTKM